MSLRAGLAGVAALWLPLGVALAQTESPPAGRTPRCSSKLEEQKQRLLILERKLELQEEAAQGRRQGHSGGQGERRPLLLPVRRMARTSSSSAACCTSTPAASTTTSPPKPPTPSCCAACARRSKAPFANIYDFRFTPDFAGGKTIILDSFVAARFRPWSVVTAGKFKVPVGLERIQSASDIRFIERAFPTSLVPNRDLGVQLSRRCGRRRVQLFRAATSTA